MLVVSILQMLQQATLTIRKALDFISPRRSQQESDNRTGISSSIRSSQNMTAIESSTPENIVQIDDAADSENESPANEINSGTEESAESSVEQVDPPKRKRGRPPKNTSAVPKSKPEASVKQSGRGRGRPPKSAYQKAQKAKKEADEIEDDIDDDDDDDENQATISTQQFYGNPDAPKTNGTSSPKKRGRPAGKKVNGQSKPTKTAAAGGKKRGRPPKAITKEVVDDDNDDETSPPKQSKPSTSGLGEKRGRGRPKKQVQVATEQEPQSHDETDTDWCRY